MTVLITGGAGRVGSAVTQRLIEHGWDVRVLGIDPGVTIPGAEYVQCDILDYPSLRQAVRGCKFVVHLAAIPQPMRVPGPDLFQINVSGTFNVFEAAEDEGIKRIVQASSINAFGCFWGTAELQLNYLPVDEAHFTHTTDVYSFSKQVAEEIGDYYWRRAGISSTALRFPGVWSAVRREDETWRQRVQAVHAALSDFAALPETARQDRLAELRAQTAAYRGARSMAYPAAQEGFPQTEFSSEPLWQLYAFERFNFWAYIDERDAAQAVEKSLTADFEGSHALFVNASDNSLGYDAQRLAQLFFPEVSQWTQPLQGNVSLVSIEKARALIGFEPEHNLS